MKTVLLGVSWLEWGGHPVLPAGPAASRGPTLSPPLSASETPARLLPGICGHLLATWGSGNHLGGQGLGLSRSPQAQGQLPLPLDKGCSRLCFSGVTEPDASNPPAGPDLQWLWGLPGLRQAPGLQGSCEGGWGWHLQPLPSPLRFKGNRSHQFRDTSFLAGFQGSVNQGQVTPHTATPASLSSICKPQNIPDSTDAGISQLLTRSSQEAEMLALHSHKRLVNLQHCTDTGEAQRGPNTSKKGLFFDTEERDQRSLVTCLKPQSKQEQGERTLEGHTQEERGCVSSQHKGFLQVWLEVTTIRTPSPVVKRRLWPCSGSFSNSPGGRTWDQHLLAPRDRAGYGSLCLRSRFPCHTRGSGQAGS